MSDWVIRDAVPEDEGCFVYTWLKSFAHAREVLRTMPNACVDGSEDERRYWKTYQPIIVGLLQSCELKVACDPERSSYEGGRVAVIWGWSCTSPGLVHWVCIKRSVIKAGLADDLVFDLLGEERMTSNQRTTFELMDISKIDLVPSQWSRDHSWLSDLVGYSKRTLAGDKLFAAVGGHVLDTRRQEWLSGEERAA